MSDEGDEEAATPAAAASDVAGGIAIDEEGVICDNSSVGDDSGATNSQTPTTSSSRRSSQQSADVADAVAAASTVPKMSTVPRSNGVRQLVAKRRKSGGSQQQQQQQQQQQPRPSAGERSSNKRSSIFTLDHVKKMFGAREGSPAESLGQQSRRSSSAAGQEMELSQRLSRLSVDTLPAVFLTKYLGEAPAAGLFGVDCIRKPVEALVKAAGKQKAKSGGQPLPIAQVTVLQQGVSVRPHPQSEGGQVAKAFHGIDSVSYAVADPGVERIFCLVTVLRGATENSSQTMKPICHAFLCNSADTAHRLVLAVTLAFETSVSASGDDLQAV